MTTFLRGDMIDAYAKSDFFFFTANSTLRQDGSLVMGAGFARQVRDLFKPKFDLEAEFGALMTTQAVPNGGLYKLLIPNTQTRKHHVCAFQTKRHFSDYSTYELVSSSIIALERFMSNFPDTVRFDLNMPGIGLGFLDANKVDSLLWNLPDNLHVWRKEK